MELTRIQLKIFEIRGQKVMLDFDLAQFYEVQTKVLNQAVKRNLLRFPEDFMFQLTKEEYGLLRSQTVTLEVSATEGRGKFSKYLPYAFTEQGVAMLATVLNSEKAIQVNIAIIRAFVAMRHFALNFKELAQKIAELETKYDQNFRDINEVLNFLASENQTRADEIEELQNQPKTGWENRPVIGFKKENQPS